MRLSLSDPAWTAVNNFFISATLFPISFPAFSRSRSVFVYRKNSVSILSLIARAFGHFGTTALLISPFQCSALMLMPVPMVVTFPFEERRNWIGKSPRTFARRRSSFKEMEAIFVQVFCKWGGNDNATQCRHNAL